MTQLTFSVSDMARGADSVSLRSLALSDAIIGGSLAPSLVVPHSDSVAGSSLHGLALVSLDKATGASVLLSKRYLKDGALGIDALLKTVSDYPVLLDLAEVGLSSSDLFQGASKVAYRELGTSEVLRGLEATWREDTDFFYTYDFYRFPVVLDRDVVQGGELLTYANIHYTDRAVGIDAIYKSSTDLSQGSSSLLLSLQASDLSQTADFISVATFFLSDFADGIDATYRFGADSVQGVDTLLHELPVSDSSALLDSATYRELILKEVSLGIDAQYYKDLDASQGTDRLSLILPQPDAASLTSKVEYREIQSLDCGQGSSTINLNKTLLDRATLAEDWCFLPTQVFVPGVEALARSAKDFLRSKIATPAPDIDAGRPWTAEDFNLLLDLLYADYLAFVGYVWYILYGSKEIKAPPCDFIRKISEVLDKVMKVKKAGWG